MRKWKTEWKKIEKKVGKREKLGKTKREKESNNLLTML